GLKNSSQIQYVVRTGRFDDKGCKFDGAMYVLRTILGYEYLWNKIRELGGAYGCSASFNKTGEMIMSSYRDPKLKETNDVYKSVPQYIREFDVDDREMLKYIIGTISGMDAPLSASDAGARSFNMYISETTIDMLREVRQQVLGAGVETIRACADAVEAALSDDNICVVGNENKIEENRELFKNTINLFE
ncbi:MAG: insulinase family protein, partial [Lachnospiraceae bacterium]|nr:insulinase family protein [Lachnospiraceae bacterium]